MKIHIAYDAADYPSQKAFGDSHREMLHALGTAHDVKCSAVNCENLSEVITEIARQQTDAVVNLCPTGQRRTSLGQMVRQSLDSLNIACTGADYETCFLQGMPLKMLAHSFGIEIPPFVTINAPEEVQTRAAHLSAPFRLTTCPHLTHVAGVSATVNDREALAHHVAMMLNPTLNKLLIEEAISGRTFDVVVADVAALDDPAVAFRAVNVTSDANANLAQPADSRIDTGLRAALHQAAVTLFKGMPSSGYILCRLVFDGHSKVTLMDVTCNADIFSTPMQHATPGWQTLTAESVDFRTMLQDQIDMSVGRRIAHFKPVEIRFDPGSGFGLYAAMNIAKGTVVLPGEGSSHRLVSNAHVAQRWSALNRSAFGQYAWPMNPHVSVIWSDKPNEWTPQNHSCEPNTLLTGLDQLARRDIQRGEAITLDYATFCGPLFSAFTCLCRAPSCRVTVTGTDYRLPTLQHAYDGHFTGHLTTLIASESRHMPFAMRRTNYGGGVTSRDAWKQHDILSSVTWTAAGDERTRWTVQVGPHRHAEMRPAELSYSNHSCNPNVEIDTTASVVRALRDIAPGDDIVWFYPSTEWQMTESFECECGAATCIGLVNGAETLAKAV